MINEIIQGDCLEIMRDIPDGSVDMILADLPYGTTACKWDTIIPFEPLWEQYERIIKDNGAIVLTASQPFTSALVMSNPKLFRHQWVWNKVNSTSGFHAKIQPLKNHEDVVVFGKRGVVYNPQMVAVERRVDKRRDIPNGEAYSGGSASRKYDNKGFNYPKSIITFTNANQRGKVHPTQKPVSLFEYLIRTYTNEGETVLDNVIGSGTTAVAAINTGRNFIGIEQEPEYVEIAKRRVDEAIAEKEGDE